MQAGKLNKRIKIQKPVVTKNEFNEDIITWQTVAEVWASIQQLGSREALSVHQIYAEANHKVTIRYMDGITPKWQVIYGTRTFDIEGVNDVGERNVTVELICRELIGA